LSFVLAFRLRPKVVITSGAGVVLTFSLVSWLLGARIVFVETMARVSTPSRTGAVLARLATLHIVQWPELCDRFPRANLCRPVLLPRTATLVPSGSGTFVSVGTHPSPFDRLLLMVDDGLSNGALPRPCLVQAGTSRFCSPRMEMTPTFTAEEFGTKLRDARYVVGHCGAGLITSALAAGRRPIIVARASAMSEHVDDHQNQLAVKLAALGLAVNAKDGINSEIVDAADAPLALGTLFDGLPDASALILKYMGDL
jgi:UDP-N-acetylglucosamine transferase subunit ALG13